MRFDGFVGNEPIKRQLAADIDHGHFPHALLLEGAPGSGRRTLASIIARAAVCRSDNRPCGVCPACRKAVHPDITYWGGEDGVLSVDAIRQLREDAFLLPNESDYRVMILAEANQMTPQAQNALLKILEEPPAHVLFLLTCENRTQLLETIRSRCVTLTLAPVAWELAAPVLTEKLPGHPEEELKRAHSLFGGTIGRVLDGVADGTFAKVLELVPTIAEALVSLTEWPLMELIGQLEKDKALTAGVLSGLIPVFRDALAIRYGGQRMLSTAPEAATKLATRLTPTQLTALVAGVEGLQTDLNRSMNNTLLLTRMSACLRQAAGWE